MIVSCQIFFELGRRHYLSNEIRIRQNTSRIRWGMTFHLYEAHEVFLKEMVILPGSSADGWLGANVTKYRSKSNKADSRWQIIFVATSSRRVWSTSLVRTQSIARDLESTCSGVAFLWNISGDLSTSLWPVFARQVNDGTGAFHDQHLWLGSETHRWLYLGQRLGQKKHPPTTTSQTKAQRALTIFPFQCCSHCSTFFWGLQKHEQLLVPRKHRSEFLMCTLEVCYSFCSETSRAKPLPSESFLFFSSGQGQLREMHLGRAWRSLHVFWSRKQC